MVLTLAELFPGTGSNWFPETLAELVIVAARVGRTMIVIVAEAPEARVPRFSVMSVPLTVGVPP